jgi:hypothetical protein
MCGKALNLLRASRRRLAGETTSPQSSFPFFALGVTSSLWVYSSSEIGRPDFRSSSFSVRSVKTETDEEQVIGCCFRFACCVHERSSFCWEEEESLRGAEVSGIGYFHCDREHDNSDTR